MKRFVSLLLSVIMVFSCFAGSITTAQASGTAPTPGDINGDGVANSKDLTRLLRFVSGEDVEVVAVTLDTNGDGNVNTKDITRLMGYLAGDPEKELAPIGCTHEMTATEAIEAACENVGNIAYWYCNLCDKYFSDAEGATEITFEETVVAATGHNYEVVEGSGYAATIENPGKQDDQKCANCSDIIEGAVIPISEYAIEYKIYGTDTYLQTLYEEGKIDNSQNPVSYSQENGVSVFCELEVPGYTFEGWYDGSGTNAVQIKSIEPNTVGKKTLYAKWSKAVYEISFDSPDVPWSTITYSVDTGKTLTNPSWFGYTFVGWSENGEIVKSIPVGTVGNKTLHANWTSNRNKAVSKPLTEPEIIEDLDNNRYLFVYEIGQIENVPLNRITESQEVDSSFEVNTTFEYSQTVDVGFIDTAATAVSNATTKTSAWTLSENWNTSTNATNEHEEEIGKTEGKTDSQGNVYGSQYYISNVKGGSTSSSSAAGGSSSTSSKITTDVSTGISNSYADKSVVDTSVDLSVEASVGASYGPLKAEVTAGAKTNTSTHDETAFECSSSRDTYVGTYDESNDNSYWDTSNTSSSSWNTTNSYTASESSSTTTEVSEVISEAIYDRWGYSSTEDIGGGTSETNSTDETRETSEEYISTIEHSTEERTTLTQEVKKTYTTPGFYRMVTVGKLYVFAVVGYDVATKSYFTYTYSILDSERKPYMDYSKTGNSFNDCENAILPFEVPFEVHEYVSDITAKSSGLEIGTNGIVDKYDGTATHVIIPEYTSVGDGTSSDVAVRVRGISATAFAGNKTLKAVSLPKYVTEIPEGAFTGCTALTSVFGYGITSVGKNAFAGCEEFTGFTIDKYFDYIGENAFKDVIQIDAKVDPEGLLQFKTVNREEYLTEEDYNEAVKNAEAEAQSEAEAVALSAMHSGAKSISIDVTALGSAFENQKIIVNNNPQYFGIINNSVVNTYKNLQIETNAEKIYLGGMTFIENVDTPLKLNSENVELSRVTVENAPGFALILEADNTNLKIYDMIALSSVTDNAVISRNVSIQKITEVPSWLQLTGNYLIYGTLEDNSLLSFISGEVKPISSGDEFNLYLTSSKVTFDPNEGVLAEDQTSKIVYYGQSYEDLPVPTREHYTFLGWFTEAEGGEEVTSESIVEALVDQTLYAHWSRITYKVNFDANGGIVETASKTVESGGTFGTLPLPVREGCIFDGWFTVDGVEVTETTTVEISGEITLKAHWSSDWILASELPSDGTVVEEKWTYDKTTDIESDKDFVEGYTLYDTTSEWSDYGEWSSWSKTAVTETDSRDVETKPIAATYKTQYNYSRYTQNSSNTGQNGPVAGTWSGIYCQYYFERGWSDSRLSSFDSQYSAQYGGTFYLYGTAENTWYNEQTRSVVVTPAYTEYRYRDRSLIYTYYHTKTENLESETEITSADAGENETISNIQMWVKYTVQ